MKDNSIYEQFPVCTIVSMINKLGTAELSKRYSAYNLGHGSHQYLVALYIEDGISQDELTRRIAVDKVSTARAVERLKNAGYIQVQVDERDRRRHNIFLTELAQERQKEILQITQQWQSELLQTLDQQECAELTRLLGKIIHSLI